MNDYPPGYVEPENLDEYLERLNNEIKQMRGLLLWALYHHQGADSDIGQPIRNYLHMGPSAHMSPEQIKEAQIAAGPWYKAQHVSTLQHWDD